MLACAFHQSSIPLFCICSNFRDICPQIHANLSVSGNMAWSMLHQLNRKYLLDFILHLNDIISNDGMDNLLVCTDMPGATGNSCLVTTGLIEHSSNWPHPFIPNLREGIFWKKPFKGVLSFKEHFYDVSKRVFLW